MVNGFFDHGYEVFLKLLYLINLLGSDIHEKSPFSSMSQNRILHRRARFLLLRLPGVVAPRDCTARKVADFHKYLHFYPTLRHMHSKTRRHMRMLYACIQLLTQPSPKSHPKS